MVMEDALRRSGHPQHHGGGGGGGGGAPGGEDDVSGGCREDADKAKVGSKRAHTETNDAKYSSSPERKDLSSTMEVSTGAAKERSAMEPDHSKASTSSLKDQDDDQLKSARAEMGEVREENQRLKMYLDRIMKDYRSLQMQFYDIMRQQETKNPSNTIPNDHQTTEEGELVSLSLGRSSSEPKRDGKEIKTCISKDHHEHEQVEEGLSLGLDCKFEVTKSDANESLMTNPSPVNSVEEVEVAKEEAAETWPPSKVLKTMPTADDDVLQQNPAKKARVSVRARCDTPTMNDGCQWRKYGQKIAKGNPCPRAYYRCTVAPHCPVRKQVQRCAEDRSILITTYEGTHNHPLPVSATVMASTTSAAASMLLSGSSSSSSTSRPGLGTPPTSTTIAADLHGLNYYLSDTSKSKQFYLHNSPFSSSTTHPTITLDLTSTPPSSSSHLFNRSFPSTYPKFTSSTTSLNFSSSSDATSMSGWGNNGFLTYGSSSQPYNKNINNNLVGSLNLGNRPLPTMESSNIYQSYNMHKNNPPHPPHHQGLVPNDTIAAATKAITADPSFQSVLAAALTSIIGGGNSSGGDQFGQKLKWGEHFPVATTTAAAAYNSAPAFKASACASSYLNKSSTGNSQAGSNLMFLPPNSLPFSSPRSASASPDDRGHTNS